MKCIVTGGAGFIGSNLVDKLIDDGHEVIVFDNYSTGKKENVNPKAKFFLVDIAHQPYFETDTMRDIMSGVDVVFHMACLARVQPSIEEPLLYHNKNVNGLVNMLEACRAHDWDKMAAEMEDSRWFKQVGRRSLELQESVLGTEKKSRWRILK